MAARADALPHLGHGGGNVPLPTGYGTARRATELPQHANPRPLFRRRLARRATLKRTTPQPTPTFP